MPKYTYSATNDSTSPVSFDWSAYRVSAEGTPIGNQLAYAPGTVPVALSSFDNVTVQAGTTQIFQQFVSSNSPRESHGTVDFLQQTPSGSQLTSFFAPMITPIPEASGVGLMAIAGTVLISQWRRRFSRFVRKRNR